MRHFVWACVAVFAIAGGTGCHSLHHYFVNGNKGGCSECGGQGCQACGKGKHHGRHARGGVPNHDPHFNGYAGHAGCQACGNGGGPAGPGDGGAGYGAGPGQVAYPYYTTRGPRDFLQDDPQSIGP